MATRSLGTLTVDLIAKIGGFTKGMTEAERATAKSAKAIEQRAQRMGKALDAAFKVAAAAFVSIGSAAAIAIKSAVDRADELSKSAQKIGVTTEALSALAYAAQLADVDLGTLQGGLARLTKFQNEAASGTEKNVALFQALGIEFKNVDGTLRNTEDVFRDFAKVFQALPDGANKTALALDVFGKSGANLIPLLNGGADGLDEMRDRAERLGLVIDGETGKAAEEFNDQLEDLKLASVGLATALAVELLPDLIDLNKTLQDGTASGDGFASTAENIANGIRGIAAVAGAAYDTIKLLVLGITNIAASTAEFASSLSLLPGADEAERFFGDVAAVTGAGATDAARNLPGGGGNASAVQSGITGSGIRGGRGRAETETSKADLALQLQYNEALNKYRGRAAEAATATAGLSEAKRLAAQAAREQEKADADLAKRLEEMAQQQTDYVSSLDELQAQLDGPLAEAQLAQDRRTAETQRLLDEGIITVEQATRAQMLYAESFAITRDELDPYGKGLRDLLESMQFELDIMGRTNAERVVANELRRLGIDLSTEEGRAAAEAIRVQTEALELEGKRIDALDDFRSSFEDNVAGVLDGSKSIKDSIRDMVDDFIKQLARLAAQKLTDSLFGAPGTSGGGGFGDIIGAFFGSFGGARAGGGPVMAGVPYLVGEQGPELIVPQSAGTVMTAQQTARMGRGGGITNINFALPGRYDQRTQAQIAVDVARVQQRNTERGTA